MIIDKEENMSDEIDALLKGKFVLILNLNILF